MQKVPHKHADVLIAIAHGQAVQYRVDSDREWINAELGIHSAEPFTNPYYEWRIKPEYKPDVISYDFARTNYFATYDLAKAAAVRNSVIIKFTIDGETGELKSAEVLK